MQLLNPIFVISLVLGVPLAVLSVWLLWEGFVSDSNRMIVGGIILWVVPVAVFGAVVMYRQI